MNDDLPISDNYKLLPLPKVLFNIASEYSQSVIVWCHEVLYESLNKDFILSTHITNYTVYSFHSDEGTCIGNDIGYIDWGTFLHVNKTVKYPTWIMSSDCGMAYSSLFLLSYSSCSVFNQLDHYLCSIAKQYQPHGLFAYSEPALLKKEHKRLIRNKWAKGDLFHFVSKHYKKGWIVMLFLHLLRKNLFISPHYLVSLLNKRIASCKIDLHSGFNKTTTSNVIYESIDVLIPTIGRSQHVIRFLDDLAQQSYPIKRVIIIEQKPNGGESDLTQALSQTWPFEIVHKLITRPGACNARNMALQLVKSDWVFMADDDIRISNDFMLNFFITHEQVNEHIYTFSCLQPGQTKTLHHIIQWASFGSGCSMVKTNALIGKKFDMRYEFGFGEDADFGMQLRNSGMNVAYLPFPEIIHLKAPMGGFRNKIKLPWEKDNPKPAPTITLYNELHLTREQYKGYVWFLFLTYYKRQHIKNPIYYILDFKRRLKKSHYWAGLLINYKIPDMHN
jgi:glycosyltransferase involved in cell wall biosynthesis